MPLVAAAPALADVPPPAPTTSVVTVKVGSDRTGTQDADVAPLAGVRLGLFATEDADEPINDTWAVCTSDADGDCNFVVPDTGEGGANAGIEPWVRQLSVPAGWYTNPVLRTGPGSGSSSVESPYQFQTPALAGGQVYTSTQDFMFSTSNSLLTSSIGRWQQSRVNGSLPAQCGIDVALLLDLSASVGSDLPNLIEAANTFADSLVGTPSRMAVFSFSATSPSAGADANHPDLISVSTQAGADQFKAQYQDWQTASGTNWDQGLFQIASAAPRYEVLVVLTDGNPTRYGADPVRGDGSRTHFRDVETGIFSANAVKAEGTRVIAVGVGRGVSGISALNLRSISGPTAFDGDNVDEADYYQTANYAQAAQALRDLALAQCTGALTVTKQIVPEQNTGENVDGSVPAGPGWEFGAATTTPGIGGLPADETTTDDGTGSVAFELTYPTGTTSATVTVTETPQSGFTLVTQGGRNAVCVDLATGDEVEVTNAGGAGFTVDVLSTSPISCTVYNRPEPAEAGVTVEKRWIVNGTSYEDGEQPDGLTASLTLTGPGDAGPTNQPFGVPRGGYTQGDTTVIDEEVGVSAAGCRLDRSRLVVANGAPVDLALPYEATLEQESNSYVLANIVSCASPSPSPTATGTPTAPPTASPTGPTRTPHPPHPSHGGGLPTTGASLRTPLTAGLVLLLLGTALATAAARRRRRTG